MVESPVLATAGVGAYLSESFAQIQRVESSDQALQLANQADAILVAADCGPLPIDEFVGQLAGDAVAPSLVVVLPPENSSQQSTLLEKGAFDCLLAPVANEVLANRLTVAATYQDLQRENHQLRKQLATLRRGEAIVGCSPATRRLVGALARAAESSATILVEGSAGTGKSLAAQMIHFSSRRMDRPLNIISCSNITEDQYADIFAQTMGGTLVLEEVHHLIASLQSKLVRYLKEVASKEAGLGGAEDQVRIITTTSAHLPELVARGKFREDLYYRLNFYPIPVPTLQERKDDVAILATHFLEQAASADGVPHAGFTPVALALLEAQPWGGNVAELQDAVRRAHSLAKDAVIDGPHLSLTATSKPEESAAGLLQAHSQDVDDGQVREEDILPIEVEEKRLLARALRATNGNVRRAAQLLRIGRATLYRKIQVYKLKLN